MSRWRERRPIVDKKGIELSVSVRAGIYCFEVFNASAPERLPPRPTQRGPTMPSAYTVICTPASSTISPPVRSP